MTEQSTPHPSPTVRQRLDAATAAAEEVVAEESGQLGGEVSALALPFEQVAAAVSAAIHPNRVGADSQATSPSEEPGPDEPARDRSAPPGAPPAAP